MMYVDFMKNFLLADSREMMAVRLILASWAKNTFDSNFLHIMYVEFMKNFFPPIRPGMMAVRLILASWAQKQVIPTLYTWCTSSSWKIFFSPIRVSWWLLDSFWHPELKNKWFLLCRHDVRRVHEKLSSRRFERELLAVRLILASWDKNKWFLLCRHDVRRVHEKFSSRRFRLAVRLILASWAQKQMIPTL